ncbi:MAG: cell envelope-related transcriptional attenuator [Nocardioidaceae bacterium]|nr:cell envelope-related transcriptional attenuator [Nocardioidaceae bacterium]
MTQFAASSVPRRSSRTAERRVPDQATLITRVRFRRALSLMLMTLVLPGSAQVAVGNKQSGRIALRVVGGLIGTLLLILLIGVLHHSFLFWLASNTFFLGLLRYVLIAMAAGWGYLFVDAWRLGNPLGLRQKQRLAMVGLNGFLCFSVAGSLLFASHVVTVQKNFISTLFSADTVTGTHDGRFNVLLLGGDSGSTRWGLRPDSITVASIDATTGKTVLFGLPRNLQNFPFAPGSIMDKQFPKGYDCDGCEINSLVTWAADHTALFKGYANPGVEATTEAVEGVTGLKMNYYAMVNLAGFRQLVDAVGGVTLTVRDPIPKGALGDFDGKSYIPRGTHKLDGADTLWFARSRMAADDYSRMARQKCVMNAMLHQLSPQQVVLKFGDIAKAGTAMLKTDIPGSELDRFMELALKARKQPIRTVSFVPPMIETYRPDITKMKAAVKDAIAISDGSKKAEPASTKKKAAPSGTSTKAGSSTSGSTKAGPSKSAPTAAPKGQTTGGSFGNIKDGYTANDTADLGSAC